MLGRRFHRVIFKTKESRAGLVRVPILRVPVYNLRPSVINSPPCDRIVQSRAIIFIFVQYILDKV